MSAEDDWQAILAAARAYDGKGTVAAEQMPMPQYQSALLLRPITRCNPPPDEEGLYWAVERELTEWLHNLPEADIMLAHKAFASTLSDILEEHGDTDAPSSDVITDQLQALGRRLRASQARMSDLVALRSIVYALARLVLRQGERGAYGHQQGHIPELTDAVERLRGELDALWDAPHEPEVVVQLRAAGYATATWDGAVVRLSAEDARRLESLTRGGSDGAE